MCVVIAPAVAAGISIASTVVAGAVSAYGAMQSSQAQSQAADYQAQVSRNNQIVANQNAQAAIQDGQAKEQQQRIQNAQKLGAIVANQGASGLDVNSGSNLLVQEDQAKVGEMDALTVRNNAQREAYGFLAQGTNYAAQAKLDQAQAGWASQSGLINAGSSIVGGAAKGFSMYSDADQAGVWG